jgi:serine/threonine-protein phosphatase 2A regulatory subunit B'
MLRDDALRNKDGSTPLPASLLAELVPQGTYNPLREQQEAEDASFGDMEEDQGPLLSGGPGGGSASGHGAGGEAGDAQPMESDDGHGDLVRLVSSGSRRCARVGVMALTGSFLACV